jgi:hypothetical protein
LPEIELYATVIFCKGGVPVLSAAKQSRVDDPIIRVEENRSEKIKYLVLSAEAFFINFPP